MPSKALASLGAVVLLGLSTAIAIGASPITAALIITTTTVTWWMAVSEGE